MDLDPLYPDPFGRLLQALGGLPGIGPKSAQRIAFFLLGKPTEYSRQLASDISLARDQMHRCSRCFFLAWGQDLCKICANPKRDNAQLMVVAEARDVVAIEKSQSYRGYYHVLGGVLSPLQNVGVADLRLAELFQRLGQDPQPSELIFALPQSVEADATRSYILNAVTDLNLRLTQLATGLPVGGDLDYIDDLTLGQALKQRVSLGR